MRASSRRRTSSSSACGRSGSPPRSRDSSRNAGRRGRSRSLAASAVAPPDDRLAAEMSTTAAPRPRVLSGIQPDFGLHLGQLPRRAAELGSRPGSLRELLLHRRPARVDAASRSRASARADPGAGGDVHRLRPRPGALRDLRAVARPRSFATVLDPRDDHADGLARADDSVQGAERGAGTSSGSTPASSRTRCSWPRTSCCTTPTSSRSARISVSTSS